MKMKMKWMVPLVAGLLIAGWTTGCSRDAVIPETVMHDVESTTFSQAGYNAATGKMTLVFHRGETYVYEGVNAATFEEFLAAESMGTYFHEHIKGNYPEQRQ